MGDIRCDIDASGRANIICLADIYYLCKAYISA